MAFDAAAAKQAGYTDQEIQSYLSGQSGQDQGVVKGASNFLKSIGLGAIPDILGGAQFGIQKALAGQNPFSAAGQTPEQLQQVAGNNSFIDPKTTGGVAQAGKDLAGAASWMVPETKILKAAEGAGLLAKLGIGVVNRGIQGVAQGALGAVSQGQNPIQGAETGAIVNPVMTGAGKVVTDLLPKYIGLRNFGVHGLKLPEVTQAQDVAAKAGQTLEQVKNEIAGNVKQFSMEDKNKLIDQVTQMAQSPSYIGAPGISDLKKISSRAGVRTVGALNDVVTSISNSADPFEAYNRIRNLAYPEFQGTDAGNKLQSFLHSVSHTMRDNLINSTSNPDVTRKAMDLYASQTAMNVAGNGGLDLGNIIKGGGGEGGLAALTTLIPGLNAASLPLAVDTVLTNKITGPPIARGLVRAGQNTAPGELFKRLGISGLMNAINGQNTNQNQ